MELKGRTGPVSRGLPKRAKMVQDAAFLGAAGLIMLDPLNRLADERIVLPLDMVCIPAYQAYMIQGAPSLQIYVRAGETIIPTGGNVKDVAEAIETSTAYSATLTEGDAMMEKTKRKRKVTAYQKKYKAAFKSIAPKYKLKNGKWKKGGFKAAVKAAHKKAGGKK
jgi:hypothetical protein